MWEHHSLLDTPHAALQPPQAIKGFTLKGIYHYVSKSDLWSMLPFSSVLHAEEIQTQTKNWSLNLHVLTVQGILSCPSSMLALTWRFPLGTTAKLMQSRKATVWLSRTTQLPLCLTIWSVWAGLRKASVEVQKLSSSVLQQAHAWMANKNSNDCKNSKDPQAVYSIDLTHMI